MRVPRRVAVICAVSALLVTLAGCSSDEMHDADASSAGEDVSQSDLGETPAARSGDLGQEDLPAPDQLGPGWTYRVDKGSAEDGYVGSGEPAIARDPASVVAAITPLGCKPQLLPEPSRALEVTYERGNVPGVGLVLQFDQSDTAQDFFNVHSGVLDECQDARRVDVSVIAASDDTIVSTRTEQLGETPSWVEAVSLDDNEITLLAVADPSAYSIATVTTALD